jgi:hypothetical protein
MFVLRDFVSLCFNSCAFKIEKLKVSISPIGKHDWLWIFNNLLKTIGKEMDKEKMDYIGIAVGSISGILIPIILYFATKKERGPKHYLISKFKQNKEKIRKYTQDLRQLLSESNEWNSILIKEQNITYQEYLKVMEERFHLEYSDYQLTALQKKFSKYELKEYIQKFKTQEDNLNLIRHELDLTLKKFHFNQ